MYGVVGVVAFIMIAFVVFIGGIVALAEHQKNDNLAYCQSLNADYGFIDMGRTWACIDPKTHILYR